MIEHELKFTGETPRLVAIFNQFSEGQKVKVQAYTTRYFDTARGAFQSAGYQLRQFSDKLELKGLNGISRPEIKAYGRDKVSCYERLQTNPNWPEDAPRMDVSSLVYKGAVYTQRATVEVPTGIYGINAEMAFDLCEYYNTRAKKIGEDTELEIEVDVLPLDDPQFTLENWVYNEFYPDSDGLRQAQSKYERLLDFVLDRG